MRWLCPSPAKHSSRMLLSKVKEVFRMVSSMRANPKLGEPTDSRVRKGSDASTEEGEVGCAAW